MKRLSLTLLFLVALIPAMQAQKYACVNTDYIMRHVPEYNQALNKLNKYIGEWKAELETKQQEVDELRERYQQEAYLLPDNLKQRRQGIKDPVFHRSQIPEIEKDIDCWE